MASLLNKSIQCHQYSIFHWLLETKTSDDTQRTMLIESCLETIIRSGNFDALETAMDLGVSLSGSLNLHSLRCVTEQGLLDMLRFLDVFFPDQLTTILGDSEINDECQPPRPDPIAEAAGIGSLSILQLLESRCHVTNEVWNRALANALHDGFLDTAEYILTKNEYTSQIKDGDLHSILETAAASAPVEVVDLLLKYFPNATFPKSILTKAASYTNVPLAKRMIDLMNATPTSLSSVFYAALRSFDVELPKYMIEVGVKPTHNDLMSAAEFCSKHGFLEGLQLVMSTAGTKAVRSIAEKCLVAGINSAKPDIVEYLMPLCSNPLQWLPNVASSRSCKIVELFMKYPGISQVVNVMGPEGTPLCRAIRSDSVDIVKLLLQVPGIDLELCSVAYKNPLVLAAEGGNMELIRVMVDAYGDLLADHPEYVNIAFQEGLPNEPDPRMFAFGSFGNYHSRREHPSTTHAYSIALELLELFSHLPGFDVNFVHRGKTPLLLAAKASHAELIESLLKYPEIDVNCTDVDGNTPLICCTDVGCLAGVKMLWAHPNTDIFWTNFDGFNAFTLAAWSEKDDILTFISQQPDFDAEKWDVGRAVCQFLSNTAGSPATLAILLGLDFDINRPVLTLSPSKSSREGERTARKMRLRTPAAVALRTGRHFAEISAHPRFDPVQSGGQLLLFDAVKGSGANFVPLCQSLGDQVNIVNSRKESLLTYACARSPEIARYIVDLPSIDWSINDPVYALMAMRDQGLDTRALDLILSHISDINAPLPYDIGGFRPRKYRLNPYDDDEGMDGSLQLAPDGVSPLVAFLMMGCRQLAVHLASLDEVSVSGSLPSGEPIALALLKFGCPCAHLEKKIDINVRDRDGNTLLSGFLLWVLGIGSWSRHLDVPAVVMGLIDMGIDIDAVNGDGLTAWQMLHRHEDECPPQPTDRKKFGEEVIEFLKKKKNQAFTNRSYGELADWD